MTTTITAPKMLGHLPKQAHRPARKPARFDSIARQQHNLRLIADRVNTGQHTAADYLTTVLHADPDFTRRYSSPFGRAAAKAHREQYGQDPAKTGLDEAIAASSPCTRTRSRPCRRPPSPTRAPRSSPSPPNARTTDTADAHPDHAQPPCSATHPSRHPSL
jgi:hypothetical protein